MESNSTGRRAGPLVRWPRFTIRRRGTVLAASLAAILALVVATMFFAGEYVMDGSISGTESQRAVDLLQDRFPTQAGDSATIVVEAPAGIDDPAVNARLAELLTAAGQIPEVTGVVSPLNDPSAVSANRQVFYATVGFDKQANDVDVVNVEQLVALVDRSSAEGFRVEAGGAVVAETEGPSFGSSELIGVGAAAIILLVAFGSVAAMGVPIVTALLGLAAGILGITLIANVLDISDFTPAFAAMIGLGVGIDYALIIVTRYREGLSKGLSVEDAIVRAMDTAGRSVIFAGSVVAIALVGLYTVGIPFVAAIGLAAAITVASAVLVALTVLPVLLVYFGHRINSWRIPWLSVDAAESQSSVWYRWSKQMQRRPWRYMIASAALLLALGIPLLSMRTGFADGGTNAPSTHTRRSYDLLVTGFGPGFNGPLLLVVERDGGLDPTLLQRLGTTLRGTEGVAAVGPAILNEAGDTAIVTVVPTTSSQDVATPRLVERLRSSVLPGASSGSGETVYVGGATATGIDVTDRISSRLPLFFGIVIGLSMVLLAAVFRSVVIPIKAAVMNLLSIGAAYGVLVAIFQWGWFAGLVGVSATGPIEPFIPMMLFAVLFGLSMDYEVFLLSRIREEYVAIGDSGEAVAHGVSATARVITAAAAIMASVFISFVLGPDRVIKEFGLGLAAAVVIDATVVRLVLVPSTMELLGRWNWWLPSWLDRALPRLNIEGEGAVVQVAPSGPAGVTTGAGAALIAD